MTAKAEALPRRDVRRPRLQSPTGAQANATYFRDTVPDPSDTETDTSDRSSPYSQTGLSSVQRTFQIYKFALTFALRYWRLGKAGAYKRMEGGMTPENVSTKKRELARWLRKGLIRLGPTFIKIGQQFSTRVDVLSPEFIKELEKLQDNVRACRGPHTPLLPLATLPARAAPVIVQVDQGFCC